MKRNGMLFFMAILILACAGCGGPEASGRDLGTQYANAEDVLKAIVDSYAEEDLFSMVGGDSEHIVSDAPGVFDIRKKEELDNTLGLPESEADSIDDAASMVHMMNANTFTGAAYHLTEDADTDAFADAVEKNILARQWICGQPDTLVMIDAGGNYIITAFGEAGIIEDFQANTLSAISGSKLLVETAIK